MLFVELKYDRGIIIGNNGQKLFLDPETSKIPIKSTSVISHSHSDHTAGLASDAKSYSTEGTERIYYSLSPKSLRNNRTIDFNEIFEINGVEVELFPAGHLLGAAQALVKVDDVNILFTGDFCPEQLLTVQAAQFPKDEVDVLIIETTYGTPSVKFRSRSENRMNILNWVMQTLGHNSIPILNVAHLGGAQELIRLFNQLTEIPIYVHPKIEKISSIYRNYGIDLQYHPISDWKGSESALVLLPRNEKNVPPSIAEFAHRRGIVTGQSAKFGYRNFEFSAPLTTHATYTELLNTISSLSPKLVITRYSYEQQFAKLVREKLGISAMASQDLKHSPIDLHKLEDLQPSSKNTSLLQFLD
ncbi:MAG: hypothetical protein D6732_03630 [Methanobacteriota archaeon]|nr:MAG: hypothetical protein D6732_03630 [Euryarchaeota archaeon]